MDVGEIIEEAYERCGLEVRTGYDAQNSTSVAELDVRGLGEPWPKPLDC